jgi:hypothetical protein
MENKLGWGTNDPSKALWQLRKRIPNSCQERQSTLTPEAAAWVDSTRLLSWTNSRLTSMVS